MTESMMKQTETTWKKACDRFAKALVDGVVAFAQAYVQHIDAGFNRADLQEDVPFLSGSNWRRLEQAGRGEIAPELVWYNGPARVLQLAPREYERLKKEGGVDIITPDGQDTRRVPFNELKAYQADLAIDRDGRIRGELSQKREMARLRDLQEVTLKRRAEKRRKQLQETGWELHAGGSATINGVTFSRQQMKRMFSEWQDIVLG